MAPKDTLEGVKRIESNSHKKRIINAYGYELFVTFGHLLHVRYAGFALPCRRNKQHA